MMMMMMMFIMIIYSSSCERRNWNEIIKKIVDSWDFWIFFTSHSSSFIFLIYCCSQCIDMLLEILSIGLGSRRIKIFTMKCFNLILLQCKILASQFLFFLPAFWLKVAHRNEHDSPKSMKWFQWNYFLLTIFASVLYVSNYWGSFKFLLQISKANKSRS